MNARSRMYTPMTSSPIPSATSLPASASGRSPFAAPDGQMIDLFGPVPVPANLSPRQAKVLGLMTRATCGRTSPGSFKSAALQSSLESRLQTRLQGRGSTLYKLTWKPWIMPSGLSRSRLRASVLRKSGTGRTGWPTPTATDLSNRTHCYSAGDKTKPVATLPGACRGLTWNGSSAQTAKSGHVNPELICWLMDIPSDWISCAPTETPSMLKRRRSS